MQSTASDNTPTKPSTAADGSFEPEANGARLKTARRRDPFHLPSKLAAFFSVGLLLWIALLILRDAWPAMQAHGLSSVASTEWNPKRNHYGILAYLTGTVASSVIAMVIALPLGVMTAIFISEDFLPNPLRQVFRFFNRAAGRHSECGLRVMGHRCTCSGGTGAGNASGEPFRGGNSIFGGNRLTETAS